MLLKITTLLIVSNLFTGCASLYHTPRDKFPDFYENASYPEKFLLVLDTIVLSDIKGSDIGVNQKKNAQARELIESAFIEALEERGHSADVLYHGDGISYEMRNKRNYVYSENRKTTGIPYEGATKQDENDQWASTQGKAFMRRLLEKGEEATKLYQEREELTSAGEIPLFLQNLPENTLLLYGRTLIEDFPWTKQVASTVLAGAASYALTGGNYPLIISLSASNSIDIVVLDASTSEIHWHGNTNSDNDGFGGTSYRNVDQIVKSAFRYFPATDGRTIYWKPHRADSSEPKSPTGCRTLTNAEVECPKK